MDTDSVVDGLVRDLRPVRPLRPVWQRLVGWLALGMTAVALVVAVKGIRADLSEKLMDPLFVNQEVAMLATAVIGAWAALSAVIPGSAPVIRWLPVIPIVGWMASMGHQYWVDLMRHGPAALALGLDPECIPGIAVAGAVPLVAMIAMLRKGAGCNSIIAVTWGVLASSALANAGLRLFHTVDGALMVIVWQFGTVVAITALSMMACGRLVPQRPAVVRLT